MTSLVFPVRTITKVWSYYYISFIYVSISTDFSNGPILSLPHFDRPLYHPKISVTSLLCPSLNLIFIAHRFYYFIICFLLESHRPRQKEKYMYISIYRERY